MKKYLNLPLSNKKKSKKVYNSIIFKKKVNKKNKADEKLIY